MMELLCKSCGGSLKFLDNKTICVCEYCDLRQTIPKADNEQIALMYNRANESRLKKRYDQALTEYQAIVREKPDHAEAYWGIVLCRYGIEYVEDYDGTMKPTIHRMQYEGILNDEDYLKAISHTDVITKEEYQREAEEIESIQKKIMATMANEEPYDVFISYKETDDDTGLRTIDSGTAKIIYDELSSQDYRVFYSRVSLKKAIGEDFEARIFAALHSAKVMILVSSKLEYANAVWVKNEWERYLQLMQNDHSKHLLTVFRGNPKDCLPSVLAQMQGQNAAEPAAEKYIAEGVEKYIGKKKQQVHQNAIQIGKPEANTEDLLQRGFMMLKNGDFNIAVGIFDDVLDIDPECAEAYLGKLMVDRKVKSQSDLGKCDESFEINNNYIKAVRFGDEALISQLKGYLKEIKTSNSLRTARAALDNASTLSRCMDARRTIQSFGKIAGMEQILNECNIKIDQFLNEEYEKAMSLLSNRYYKEAYEKFAEISKYETDKERIARYSSNRREATYYYAVELQEKEQYADAARLFMGLSGYNDSRDRAQVCRVAQNKEKQRQDAINRFRKEYQDQYGSGKDSLAYFFADKYPEEEKEYSKLTHDVYLSKPEKEMPWMLAASLLALIAAFLIKFGIVSGVPLTIANIVWVVCVGVFIGCYESDTFTGVFWTAIIAAVYFGIHYLYQAVEAWTIIGPIVGFIDSLNQWIPLVTSGIGFLWSLNEVRHKLRLKPLSKRADEYYYKMIESREKELKNYLNEKYFQYMNEGDYPTSFETLRDFSEFGNSPGVILDNARSEGLTLPQYEEKIRERVRTTTFDDETY